jgi:hypothetical protein
VTPQEVASESSQVVEIRSPGIPEIEAIPQFEGAIDQGETSSRDVSLGLVDLGAHRVEYDEDLIVRLEALDDPTPDVADDEDDDL